MAKRVEISYATAGFAEENPLSLLALPRRALVNTSIVLAE
jgi:hypothetical protein